MKLFTIAAAAAVALLASGPAQASTKAKFICKGGSTLGVAFKGNKARVSVPGAEQITLTQALSADGFLYTKGKYSLRGKGDKVTWTAGNAKPLSCKTR